MTYYVSSGTLNSTNSTQLSSLSICLLAGSLEKLCVNFGDGKLQDVKQLTRFLRCCLWLILLCTNIVFIYDFVFTRLVPKTRFVLTVSCCSILPIWQVSIFTDTILICLVPTSLVHHNWYCLPPSSITNPRTLFLVFHNLFLLYSSF